MGTDNSECNELLPHLVFTGRLALLSGFPGSSMIRSLPISTGDVGLIPGLGRSPGGGKGSSWEGTSRAKTPVFLPGKSHGQGSLAGYSPWNLKELDRTERLKNSKVLLSRANLVYQSICDFLEIKVPFKETYQLGSGAWNNAGLNRMVSTLLLAWINFSRYWGRSFSNGGFYPRRKKN